jgi:hypothetical protein
MKTYQIIRSNTQAVTSPPIPVPDTPLAGGELLTLDEAVPSVIEPEGPSILSSFSPIPEGLCGRFCLCEARFPFEIGYCFHSISISTFAETGYISRYLSRSK